jgi:hypothetical protein
MKITAKMRRQAWMLPIVAAVMLAPGQWNTANAQTAISFSLTGTGTGTINSFSLMGSGTVTPYGPTTIAITGGTENGSFGISFVVRFGDGSTVSATSTPTLSKNVFSGTATIISGTGTFAGASGSYTYMTTITLGSSSSLNFTSTGSGTITISAISLPSDLSFLSTTSPSDCGTSDNAVITSQTLFGSGVGFGCLKTLILPQFAVADGWTSQGIFLMPAQAATAGLVTGTMPGFLAVLSVGAGATATLSSGSTPVLFGTGNSGCLGLWATDVGSFPGMPGYIGYPIVDSGATDSLNFVGVGNVGGCGPTQKGSASEIPGSAEGPLQVQIVAPNANALSQATVQLTYYYQEANVSWQVTVAPVDVNAAKPQWTAPLFQGGQYVTAFSVVNVSNAAQTVSVTLRDGSGNQITSPKTTPSLAAGCGCNQLNHSATGGFYAATVTDLFGDIGTQTGSIEFSGTGNIVVIVLRTVGNSLGSVPAV